MVSFSIADAAVLWFGDKPLRGGANVVLWPLWGWRVSAPGRRPTSLDMFALHVLRLCKVGLWDAQAIAMKLGLEPVLVTRVMLELVGSGFVTSGHALTEAGTQALREVLVPTEEDWCDGWVFQDPWSGDLHPFFATELSELRREFRDSGRIALRVGSMGDARSIGTFFVRAPSGSPGRPDRDQVIDACQRYRNLVRSNGWSVPASARTRVAFLDEAPTPFWVVVTIAGSAVHEQSDVAHEHQWRASDPFGLGREEHFRTGLVREARHGSDAGSHLSGAILRGRASDEATLAYEGMLARHGVLHEREPWFAAALEMERLGATGQHRHAIKEARTVVELALGSLVTPGAEAWRELFDGDTPLDRTSSSAVLKACAKRLGFEGVPGHVFRVHPSTIRSVFGSDGRNPGWQLGATMAALVLVAHREPGHRVRALAEREPTFFRRVQTIAGEGNTAVHDIRKTQTSEPVRAEVHRILTLICEA